MNMIETVSQSGVWRAADAIPALKRSTRLKMLLHAAALYALCFAVLSAIAFAAPGFLGTDDYYHTRIATEMIEQRRLAVDFPWLPLTILNPEHFVDHHLLFHLYIAPWAALGGVAGAKLATASIAAGVFVAAWALLRALGVRYAALWTLGLFGLSVPFVYRMLMVRTQGASLLLLIVALLILQQRRYRWLIPLGFAYAWLYNGFVLLIAIAGLYTLAAWITDRRWDWRPPIYTALGIGLGLIINPYFPANVMFIMEHLGAKVAFESGVRVGNEWYPYTTGGLLAHSGGALLMLALGALRPAFEGHRRDRMETALLLIALLTLFMLLRSRRFIEYYPAFALLYGAAAWGRGAFRLAAYLPRRVPERLGYAALVLLAAFAMGNTLTSTYQDAQSTRDVEEFAGASAWLAANTPPGALVFQTDWDDFTRLFYYNTHNVYLVGLDPTYLERADGSLWEWWVAITRGEVEQPSAAIRAIFGASYVVSDTRHRAFEDQAALDPGLELVFEDRHSLVWRVVPEAALHTNP